MKLIKERSIAVVFDAVSISKDIEILGGPLTQNFYSESRTYIPNRFITPILLTPKVYIVDPNNIIPSGDKHEELLECIWYENGNKIITNDEYKLNKDNTLTVLKNSEKDFTISYSAKWLDPRKKQVITVEDSVQFVTIALGDGNIKPRLTLDKAQNWIHNPLKNERIYSIKAYVSKDKLYEGAVEWYCTLKGAEKKLIDTSFLFYEGGQYSNELKVNSAYMPDCIITAKNISDSKLKEIYWFFDKHGNPLTYATPDKTIIEGSNVFSLPGSPITSKLDYRIEGLTLNQLVKNGDFKNKLTGYGTPLAKDIKEYDEKEGVAKVYWLRRESTNGLVYNLMDELDGYNLGDIYYLSALVKPTKVVNISIGVDIMNNIGDIPADKWSKVSTTGALKTEPIRVLPRVYFGNGDSMNESDYMAYKYIQIFNLTQTFGAGNEPTKEWCDEHITGYFEGVKSVQTPMRVKSVGENLCELFYNKSTILGTPVDLSFHKWTSEGYLMGNWGIHTSIFGKMGGDVTPRDISKLPKLHKNTTYYFNYKTNGSYSLLVTLTDREGNPVKRFNKNSPIRIGNEDLWMDIQRIVSTSDCVVSELIISKTSSDYIPYTESNLYINNQLELKRVGEVSDYIENGKLYKNISDNGEILEETEVINLSTNGSLTTYPNGTIFIDNAIQLEEQYQDGITIKEDYPIQILESIKVGTEYLDVSKAVVKDNLITHPELENGVFVTVEYIYDDSPIYGINSIGYLSLEEILDAYWLENVYTYKVTNGEWELVKVTDIEDYEEWLKTEKTSPYTLAPDGIIFGKYEANTKFLRQFPSSLYVDFIAPDRLKEGVTQIKARALVGTKDGVIDKPSRYFKITWLKRALRPGQQDIVIGTGDEILVDVGEKDAITIEIEDLGILKSLVNEQGEYLIEENNKILVGR